MTSRIGSWSAVVGALGVMAMTAGCRTADADNFPCSASGSCPPSYRCGPDQLCHGNGKTPDASACEGGACSAGGAGVSVGGGTPLPGSGGAGGQIVVGTGGIIGSGGAGGTTVCTPGGLCDVGNECHSGRISCETGKPMCADMGAAPDGSACGIGAAMVCAGGVCSACATGSPCDRPQPCKIGRTSCTTGSPVCLEAGNAGDGKPCGSGMVCAAGGCVACNDGAPCVPAANACHHGVLSCAGGSPVCTDTTMPLDDGSTCDTDKVCFQGNCSPCKAGGVCDVPNRPCRTGTTSCNTGQALCVDSDNATNGKSCGTGMVCKDGTCAACMAGAPCAPTNACHVGKLDCAGGAATCTDTAASVGDGMSCGTGKVCFQGGCLSCTANQDCVPMGTVCKAGKTSCTSGMSMCVASGNAGDGSPCGTNQVCSAGKCVACAANTPCPVTAAPCHKGLLSCGGGVPSCTDQNTNIDNGTSCGTDYVCNAGSCVACKADGPCTPGGNSCLLGKTVCSSGASVCMQTGMLSNGSPCGSGANMVCSNGQCMACTSGGSCPPSNLCHQGTLSCSSGSSMCTDTGASAANGTSCGTNLACVNGTCSCSQGVTCNTGDPCKVGKTDCATGAMICKASGNAADSTPCAAGKVCMAGTCTAMSGCDGTPQLGCPCTTAGAVGCNTPGPSRVRLSCGTVPSLPGFSWQMNGANCSTSENCDRSDGTCKPILTQCSGHTAGFAYCDASPGQPMPPVYLDVRKTCGPDLVSNDTTTTCSGICSNGVCQSATCGDRKVEAPEECDDGNLAPLDGCDPPSCTKSVVQKISAGEGHTCALCKGGFVRCWGENTNGELGLGHVNVESDKNPYQLTDAQGNPGAPPVALGTPATDVSAGVGFSCALLTGGSVRCWGRNDLGQLGLGNATAMPTQIAPAINFGAGVTATAISAGQDAACALLSNGTVRCWGDNSLGLLGLGNTNQVFTGTVLLPAGTPTGIAVGGSNACVRTASAVHCWGDNFLGEFGLGTMTPPDTTMASPASYGNVMLSGTHTPTSLTVGGSFICSRLEDGEAECWGFNNVGQLGLGTTQTIGDNEPPGNTGVVALGAATVTSIAAGASHTCAVLANNAGMKCWGNNNKGQLGYGDTAKRGNTNTTQPISNPVLSLPAGTVPTAVTTGSSHTCALMTDASNVVSVRCWGWNNRGQLGQGKATTGTTDFIGGQASETPAMLPTVKMFSATQ